MEMSHGMRRILGVVLTLHALRAPAEASGVVQEPGTIAVADSEHRDRWGANGNPPQLVQDGDPKTCWVSDNWEVTHTIALLLPKAIRVTGISVVWARWGSQTLTPTQCILEGLQDCKWVSLKVLSFASAEPTTTVELPGVVLCGIRLIQPPGAVRAEADRRMGVAELHVIGEPIDPIRHHDVEAARRALVSELRHQRRQEDGLRVAPCIATVMKVPKSQGYMGIIDRTDLQRGRRNVSSRTWARLLADQIIRDANWWTAQTDAYVRGLLPEGNPRALCPSFEKGCPIHGGARQTFRATLESGYRWTCGKGGEVWYDGAVIRNPETGESVIVRDDGHGWVAPKGFLNPGTRYHFVAAYRYYLLGKLFSSPYEPDGGSAYQGMTPVMALALAHAITGEPSYAHKAAVMLNRLAELYRFFDGTVEGPSQRQDGYIGQTFERFLVQNLILSCDLIWDQLEEDVELREFFQKQGGADYDGDGQVTGADLRYNLQRNLLGYVYEYLHRLMPYFDGDFLMYEMTGLAGLAKVLGNPDIAVEVLDSDVGLRTMLNNSWFRDGKFIYDASGYNVGNAQTPLLIAEWIHGFQCAPRFDVPVDVYNDPACPMGSLFHFLRHIDCDGRVPMIGDTGATRGKLLHTVPQYSPCDERAMIRLPRQRKEYLNRLLSATGGDIEKYREGRADWWLLFHAEPVEAPPRPEAPMTARSQSHLFDDGGIAILRAGSHAETRQHVCLTLSKGSYGHGHGDKLAINLFRYGYDLSADVGYPSTWTDLKCSGWETHTASHCTVMLDEQPQRFSTIGRLHLFAAEPPCDVVEASAERAYAQATLYRRTVAIVRDDDGEPLYTLDLFRVAGAKTRDYHFHSLGTPEDLNVRGSSGTLVWTKQVRGSLAGPNVTPMSQGGYGFLYDVQTAEGSAPFTAVWEPKLNTLQPDRYLLSRRSYRDCTVEFKITRTPGASGRQERAVFVFTASPSDIGNRRVIMLPVESLPVGKAVAVRVEMRGSRAQMTFDGRPVGRVDVSGQPGDSGSLGFLHYYNYAFEYRDLRIISKDESPLTVDLSRPLADEAWSRIDPTYETKEGVLTVRDCESVSLYLHMTGSPGRTIIRASAEGPGVRGHSPIEGHLVIRDRPADTTRATHFWAVLEAQHGASRIRGIHRS